MGILCGSIKVSNQRGVLTSLSVSYHNRLEDVSERAEAEEDLIQVSLVILNVVDSWLNELDILVHIF